MTEKSPGVTLILAFYFKATGGFFLFLLVLADQKEKPGLFVAQ